MEANRDVLDIKEKIPSTNTSIPGFNYGVFSAPISQFKVIPGGGK